MSDVIAEAFVSLRPQLDKFGAEVQTALNRELVPATKAADSGFANLKRTVAGVAGGFIAAQAGIASVNGAFRNTIGASMAFETSFAGVIKTVDATDEEIQSLASGFRQMAKEIPVNVNEINRIGEAAGQLGIETENILGFARVMADLGVATNMSSDEAATALARLANITQMPQSEFDRLGAVVVELGNNLATTESEIVAMGLRIAGAGSQVGLTEAQILGLAGAMSSLGIQAEAGGTAISRVMIDIASEVENSGENLENFARVAGMSAEQFSQAWQDDAAGALVSFITGLGNMEEQGSSTLQVLEEMGISEIRVRDALLRMSGAQDLLTDSMAMGTEAHAENVALTKEAEMFYGTTANQLQVLKNRMADYGITIGDAVVPALLAAATAGAGFVDKIVAMAQSAGPVVELIRDFATSVGERLLPHLQAFGDWISANEHFLQALEVAIGSVLVAAFGALGLAISAVVVQAVLLAAPLLAMAAAIGAVSAGVYLLIQYWDEVTAKFPVLQTVADNAVAAFNRLSDATERIVAYGREHLPGAIDTARSAFDSIVAYIQNPVVPAFENVASVVRAVGEKVIDAHVWMFEQISRYWPEIWGVIEPILNQIQNLVVHVFEVVTGVLDAVIKLLAGDFSGAWEATKGVLSSVVEFWIATLRNGIDLIKGLFGLMWSVGRDLVVSLYNAASEYFTGTVIPWFAGLPGRAVDAVGSVLSTLAGKGKDLLTGLWNGAKDVFTDVHTWFIGLPGKVISAIGSVSSLLYRKGRDLVQGLIDGINSLIPSIPNPLSAIPGGGAIGGALSWIPGYSTGAWEIPGPRGAGDVFPAFLSPGEMVLPPEMGDAMRSFLSHNRFADLGDIDSVASPRSGASPATSAPVIHVHNHIQGPGLSELAHRIRTTEGAVFR